LKSEEYADYQGDSKIAGGFQSPEIGINVPKYLAMLQAELEAQQRKGNITIRTGHAVQKEGIQGKNGGFSIQCKTAGGKNKIIRASQVVQAAWSGGSKITPHFNQEIGEKEKIVTVYRRAMLLVDLPAGWKTPPAFILRGEDGGMLSPDNDKTARCYLPTEEGAYLKQHDLTKDEPTLPEDWERLSEAEKNRWTETYFRLLKERFPALKNATNPRLMIRDTLNFQQDLSQREYQNVQEVAAFIPKFQMSMSMEMEMVQEQKMEQTPVPYTLEVKPGLFMLYPTKATFCINTALQAAQMVKDRSLGPHIKIIKPLSSEEILGFILKPWKREQYSLAEMKTPDKRFFARFFREHPDLSSEMLKETWPQEGPGSESWVQYDLLRKSAKRAIRPD